MRVGKLATTIPSRPTLRRCAAPRGASLLARSWNREACDARHLIREKAMRVGRARPRRLFLGLESSTQLAPFAGMG